MLMFTVDFLGGNMSFNSKVEKIDLLVYSADNLIRCNVVESLDNKIKAAPIASKVDMFQAGYPVVCMFISEGVLKFRNGEISEVDNKNLLLVVDMPFEVVIEERRIFERYPVSLEVSARRKFSNKRFLLIAKDLSEYGMGAVSKIDLEMDEIIDMNLITGRYMFYFVGKVTWKQQKRDYFDYGFQLTEFDITTKASMASYLGKLNEDYKKLYEKTK